MKKSRVLLADPHVISREGLKSLLQKDGQLQFCGEVQNSSQLYTYLESTAPDILIIDLFVENHFSPSDLILIKSRFPNLNILVFTSNGKKEDIIAVLENGVEAYLLKECNESEVLKALTAISNKEKFYCNKVKSNIVESIYLSCSCSSNCENCRPSPLSKKELEIVELLVNGYTTRKIAEECKLSVHTINTHRRNILKKLDLHSTSELIAYAFNNGLFNPKA